MAELINAIPVPVHAINCFGSFSSGPMDKPKLELLRALRLDISTDIA